MKKLILSLVSCLVASASFGALTFTTNLATTIAVTIPNLNQSAVVAYVLLSSDATHTGSAQFFDSPGLWNVQTNAAYSYKSVYGTNYVTTYTNYYGATNNLTNVVVVSVSNYVAAANLAMTPKLQLSIGTNTSAVYPALNINFAEGIMITNTSGGTIGVTVGYVQ